MDSSRSTVSVVVSTFDERRWKDLVDCIRSLERQSRPPLEVIVVVDHNPDLLVRVRRELLSVHATLNARSRGLAGARNTGIDLAKGSIVAFIDDDATAEEDWLAELEDCFSAPQTVGAGGALLPRWPSSAPGWFPSEFYWVVGCSYTGLPERLAPVRNPIGANMAVRASVLDEVGGFREGADGNAPRALGARGVVRAGGNVPDDTDLAIRVKQVRPDAVWLYQPAAKVVHKVTPERTSIAYFLRRSFEEGVGKASLASLVGWDSGLASERRHLAVVLPKGVWHGLKGLLRGNGSAGLRALAILAGTVVAGAGYLSVAVPRIGRGTRPAI
jgi:glycosyltransferase involved in cell wall biosynthesis